MPLPFQNNLRGLVELVRARLLTTLPPLIEVDDAVRLLFHPAFQPLPMPLLLPLLAGSLGFLYGLRGYDTQVSRDIGNTPVKVTFLYPRDPMLIVAPPAPSAPYCSLLLFVVFFCSNI